MNTPLDASPAALSVDAPAEARTLLLAHLHAEGFPARVDDDGDIVFRFEGLSLALCFDPDDAQFGKLLLPFVADWPVDADGTASEAAWQALNEVSRRIKCVKGYTMQGHVHLAVELVLPGLAQWQPVLLRCVRALAHARGVLVQGLRAAEAATEAAAATPACPGAARTH